MIEMFERKEKTNIFKIRVKFFKVSSHASLVWWFDVQTCQ